MIVVQMARGTDSHLTSQHRLDSPNICQIVKLSISQGKTFYKLTLMMKSRKPKIMNNGDVRRDTRQSSRGAANHTTREDSGPGLLGGEQMSLSQSNKESRIP